MTWELEIAGDPWVLEQLSQALQSDDIKLLSSNATFSLVGRVFDGIADERDARSIAEEKLSRLSGIAMLTLQLRSPLQITSVTHIDDSGHAKSYITTVHVATIETHMSCVVTDAQGNVISRDPSPESLATSFNLAGLDKSVDKVLRLLGDGDLSWVNLYRLYEIVRDDVGGEKAIASRGWCQPDDLKLFRWTANHPEASGDSARHGSIRQDPPEKPMELAQAQTLIRTMVQKWLQEKT